jgi:hypothetical protein
VGTLKGTDYFKMVLIAYLVAGVVLQSLGVSLFHDLLLLE